MVWIHLDVHVYIFFLSKLNILCVFWSSEIFFPFFFQFRFGSTQFQILGVHQFGDRSNFDNIGAYTKQVWNEVEGLTGLKDVVE
jgi:hypothetical protein